MLVVKGHLPVLLQSAEVPRLAPLIMVLLKGNRNLHLRRRKDNSRLGLATPITLRLQQQVFLSLMVLLVGLLTAHLRRT